MKTTEKKTTTTATESKATFADILREYEKQAARPTSTTAYEKALTNLATAVAYSVLKKCINVSQDKTLMQARQSIARDLASLDRIQYVAQRAYRKEYTADGDKRTVVADKDLDKALTDLCKSSFGDGLDLVNTAVVAILSETEKARQTAGGLTVGFMERPYQVRRLNRKVWIKAADSVNGWQTVDTTAIQETYKAVRRYIDSNRAIKNASYCYTYLDENATDTKSGVSETIYRRFGKYADIGGTARDYNGKETFYTADETTARDIDTLVEKMNLTAKQAKILALRQSGCGYKAIATYLGVTQRAVAKTVQAIQVKAAAIGLTPDTAHTAE